MLAITPDKMDITLDEDYQEVEVEIKPTREELMARFHVRRPISLFFFK
jgi:hypothetical protein